ncbi:peptidoglycan D,D-transpeptidase FtsI family protein [Ornithinimicrobium sufpigmenti]|uniref:peptidoglycan D,D-transpeptidase FtsI family protein n=1 Tax=Ornithinimicrobium sufpigmenti TaxID=2508882 RepID=UPI0011AE66EF|nr:MULTISPECIES: penicillin-binding protein 2 [unclassified Ornithinimicrobium]
MASGVVHPARRARVLLVGIFLVLSLFAAQLVRLQGLDAASVSAAALDGRLQSMILPAARGTITDVNGQPLAISVERKRIIADPTLVVDYERREDGEVVGTGFAAAADVVAEVTGADRADVLRRLEDPLGEQYAVLVPDASPQQWQELRARGVRGLSAEDLMRRDYPLGESAAPLVGWIGAGEQPAGGLELVHHEALTGTPGEAVYEAGSSGEIISTGLYEEEPAVPGQDLRLTLDADIQWYAHNALKDRIAEADALSGYAAVMEVGTGRLLALTSYPGFDPSDSTQTSEGMRNAAVEDVYEPGSTSKLVTAAAALEEGIAEPDTPIVVPIRVPRGGVAFKDATEKPVQYLTFSGVLAHSSNKGTILYGEKLTDEQLYEWNRKFGMGSLSGLGLPGESTGLVPEPSTWSATSRYTMMFGQGLSSTLLQQMGVFQTVANGGITVPPTLVAGTVDQEGRYVEAPLGDGSRVISEETATQLTEMMTATASPTGTAPLAAVPGYHIAGKSSTATRVDPQTGRYTGGVTSSFMGFAPAQDPKYIVAVVIQRPRQISEFGGVISGPPFADIMRYTLQKNGVLPDTTPQPEVELEFDPEEQAPGHPAGVTLEDIAIKDERTGG